MRIRLIFCTLVFVFTLPAFAGSPVDSVKSASSVHDRWFATDKAHHFLVSAFLTAAVNYTTREEMNLDRGASQNISIGITLSVGLGKEIFDGTLRKQSRRHFSCKDLVADCAGIITGILLFNATE